MFAAATTDDQDFHDERKCMPSARVRRGAGKGKRTVRLLRASSRLRATAFVLESCMAKNGATYSVLKPGCPSRLLLERIADKWTTLIIQNLAGGTLRYSALQRGIGDISQKMLTQTLRSLERDGLVRRKIYQAASPKVEYTLTPLGRTLIDPLQGLCRWSEKHLAELESHRVSALKKTTAPSGLG